jgi:hypothetical protein
MPKKPKGLNVIKKLSPKGKQTPKPGGKGPPPSKKAYK